MLPVLHIHLKKIEANARFLKDLAEKFDVEITGVTKVLKGDPKIAQVMKKVGINMIGDSRVQNIMKMKKNGIEGPFMLLRIPMISELKLAIEYVDIFLISELKTARNIDEIAKLKNKKVKVVYMIDVGDLREGVWFKNALDELKEVIKFKNLILYGIGTNLGCFGGVIPTEENMRILLDIKERFEKDTSYKLKMISGGNTAALHLLENGNLPRGINNYRLGESIIKGTDITNNRNIPGTYQDTVILEAEIIEKKWKPSVPYGKTGFDSMGRKHVFKDKGKRLRIILAIGEQDIDPNGLIPLEKGLEVLHASSDHTIVDITEYKGKKNFDVGESVLFMLNYSALLRAATSEYVEKVFYS